MNTTSEMSVMIPTVLGVVPSFVVDSSSAMNAMPTAMRLTVMPTRPANSRGSRPNRSM